MEETRTGGREICADERFLRTALPEEFEAVKTFYWDLIDASLDRRDTVGWKKGI